MWLNRIFPGKGAVGNIFSVIENLHFKVEEAHL
jgi:hypothetical protein